MNQDLSWVMVFCANLSSIACLVQILKPRYLHFSELSIFVPVPGVEKRISNATYAEHS